MNGCRIEWSITKGRTPRVRRLSWYLRMDGRPASKREPVPLRRNRDFVLLQIGQALSTVGSEASGIAYTLLVLALTGSPAKAGLAGFARLVPLALFARPAGVASHPLQPNCLVG